MILIVFICLAQRTYSQIYQSGNFAPSSCGAIGTQTIPISFPSAFVNKPQIAIMALKYDCNSPIEFTLQITSTSTTNFIVEYKCLWVRDVITTQYYWLAFDDQRIEIINCFNKNVSNLGNFTQTYPHYNYNAIYGFTNLITYGQMDHSFYFQIQITEITPTNVTVSVTFNNTNVLSLGYQIVLGTPEALSTKPFTQTGLLNLNSKTIYYNIQSMSGYEFFLPYQGMSFQINENQRLNQTITYNSNSTVSYALYEWYVSNLSSLIYQEVWINKNNQKVLQPLYLKKMRVPKAFNMDLDQYPIKLTILIDKSKQTLNLIANFQCSWNRLITGKIMKCYNCGTEKAQYTSGRHLIKLYQPDNVYQQISLVVTTNSFTISQLVINQATNSTYNVLAISMS